MDVNEALELGQKILDMIEDDVSEEAIENADPDFFSNVEEKTKGIMQTIEERQRVSDGQANALQNMHDGVAKWIR